MVGVIYHGRIILSLIVNYDCKSAQNNWWDERQDHIDLKENPNHRLVKKVHIDKDFMVADSVYLYERGLLDKDGQTDAYENLTKKERDCHFTKSDEEQYYQATVYNIEVEDHHTYFVGEAGIWVHDGISTVRLNQ